MVPGAMSRSRPTAAAAMALRMLCIPGTWSFSAPRFFPLAESTEELRNSSKAKSRAVRSDWAEKP